MALFDRKRRTTEYKAADSGYVSAWYLDEDYDGDCFVDCQMFFDFKKTPNIKAALKAEVDPEEFTLKLTSEPFPVRGYKRIAVKVVDVYGNESPSCGTWRKERSDGLRCRSRRHLRRLPRAGEALPALSGGRSKLAEGRRPSMRFLASAKDVKGGIAGVVGKEAGSSRTRSRSAEEQLNDSSTSSATRCARGARPATPAPLVTRRLLEWWFERDEERRAVGKRFFFCQQEAVETVIYLYEVRGGGRCPRPATCCATRSSSPPAPARPS